MITFSSTGKLQAKLASAVAASEVQVVATYVDAASVSLEADTDTSQTNGATAVDIVAAPAASVTRKVQLLNFYNQDTAPVTLTVQYLDNATTRVLWQGELLPAESLQYVDGRGFFFAVSTAMRYLPGHAAFRGPKGKALLLDSGATAMRPGAPLEGMIRHNSETPGFEGYSNGAWGAIGGGSGDRNVDGGFAASTYTAAQLIDGGTASG